MSRDGRPERTALAKEPFVRRPLSLAQRARPGRSWDERLVARAPALYRAVASFALSLPPRAHLRRAFVERAARSAFAAYNRRDFELVLVAYDPQIEFHSAMSGLLDLESAYHGHDGLRRFWALWLEAWEEFEFEPAELIDFRKQTLFLIKVHARAGESGIEAPHELAISVTYRGGAIVRHEEWRAWADALEGLGVRS